MGRYIDLTDSYSRYYCVMDFQNSVATDIFTGNQFYVLKKDFQDRILACENDKILMGQNYGVEVSKVELKKITVREQIKLMLEYLKFNFLRNNVQNQEINQKQNVIKR